MARSGRTIWVVDAAYLFTAQKTISPTYNFDYLKLRNYLETEGVINAAYYLNSTQDPPTDAQDRFHSWLKTARPEGPQFIVKLYRLKEVRHICNECGKESVTQVQQGVDVGIATQILIQQNNFENLILSSGDGDLLDAVRHIREYSAKRFELCVFKSGVSLDLQAYADKVHWIDSFAQKVSRTASDRLTG